MIYINKQSIIEAYEEENNKFESNELDNVLDELDDLSDEEENNKNKSESDKEDNILDEEKSKEYKELYDKGIIKKFYGAKYVYLDDNDYIKFYKVYFED